MIWELHSRDGTIELTLAPTGIVLRIAAHEWHWTVSSRDSSLRFAGPVLPVPAGHSSTARRPEDCPLCREFILPAGQ